MLILKELLRRRQNCLNSFSLNVFFFFFFPICPQGKTVTLKLKNVNFEVKTRALTLPYPVATVDEIFTVAKDLLKTERDNESPQPLRLRLMGN